MVNPEDVAKLITEDPDLFNEGAWEDMGFVDPGLNAAKKLPPPDSYRVQAVKAAMTRYNLMARNYGSRTKADFMELDYAFEETPEYQKVLAGCPQLQKFKKETGNYRTYRAALKILLGDLLHQQDQKGQYRPASEGPLSYQDQEEIENLYSPQDEFPEDEQFEGLSDQ